MPQYCPGSPPPLSAACEVNLIGLLAVPTALIVPLTLKLPLVPLLKSTVTPGSIVSVTPEFTVTAVSRSYGLPLVVQVVFVVMFDLTSVLASADCTKQPQTRQTRTHVESS